MSRYDVIFCVHGAGQCDANAPGVRAMSDLINSCDVPEPVNPAVPLQVSSSFPQRLSDAMMR